MFCEKIEIDDIVLLPIDDDDLQTYANWLNDPSIMEGYSSNKEAKYTLSQVEDALLMMGFDPETYVFGVYFKNVFIGKFSLDAIDFDLGIANVRGFIGDKRYRGKGNGAKILRAVCEYGFHTLGLKVIYSYVTSNNIPSLKAAKAVGFEIKSSERFDDYERYYIELYPKPIMTYES